MGFAPPTSRRLDGRSEGGRTDRCPGGLQDIHGGRAVTSNTASVKYDGCDGEIMAEDLFSHVDVYDAFFEEKNYEGEADFFAETFERRGRSGGNSCLVLGCGSGRHSEHLEEHGFEITGVDSSGRMVERARDRSDGTFRQGTLPDVNVEADSYDLVLLPFNVINYIEYDDLVPTFELVETAIKPGGVLIFDNAEAPSGNSWPIYLQTVDGADGQHARIVHMKPGGDHYFRWRSIVFSEQAESGFFLDNWNISIYEHDHLVETLEELGFSVERRDSYGDATKPQETISAYIAVKETDAQS